MRHELKDKQNVYDVDSPRGYSKMSQIGYAEANTSREVMYGPITDYPFAFMFGLCTVVDGTSTYADQVKAAVDVRVGDKVDIHGLQYEFYRHGGGNLGLRLDPDPIQDMDPDKIGPIDRFELVDILNGKGLLKIENAATGPDAGYFECIDEPGAEDVVFIRLDDGRKALLTIEPIPE